MVTHTIKNYIYHNFIRVAEILVIIASVFFTMQYNIKSQGELLIQLSQKNEEVGKVLQGLMVTVATIQTNQENMRRDIEKLEEKHKAPNYPFYNRGE